MDYFVVVDENYRSPKKKMKLSELAQSFLDLKAGVRGSECEEESESSNQSEAETEINQGGIETKDVVVNSRNPFGPLKSSVMTFSTM